MKINPNTIQPIEGKPHGNGTIFGKERGHTTQRIISRSEHKRLIRQNPSEFAKIAMEKTALAKNIAKEICGLAPYEKKAIDFGRRGEEKKMRKFLKKRLGSLKGAKARQERLLSEMRHMN
ncbi:large subunit ribosomal protein L36e [Nematocida ausubeli]|uniref:50S ribosomal protein L36e n=1 Tax=Nematocida ausubeli (strain ATCC PRA-371 / ERTm2) TaxID=1913371 RepID=H8Z927_NEMA1|nr:50S ribosomal protein L36e [Nematocida ausubeli]EHY66458.1 50S ribosomal protein L36e [Nematocida ausubeli]KAI5133892.1 large subunit ribosomal protein L36e [Nematocida ausubeli]KAI5136142.1 large subunit ribosomal protein L36e [Nematocida ausubeli]KAI5149029.1 large subunit ribosomal protein L36e [Nematocida ausubeli]KAI5161009.1 large subunit ribosomal protein L36e [Nematocida ausubeli]